MSLACRAGEVAMAARSKARKRALDVLFEAEIRAEPVLPLLDERVAAASPPVSPYAAGLVRRCKSTAPRSTSCWPPTPRAGRWTGCPAVDRNILRIGTAELLWQRRRARRGGHQRGVQLARDLSTDGSPSFVNGLLARLLELKPGLAL